jgi:peptide/nickel transport system substrate-binding protein
MFIFIVILIAAMTTVFPICGLSGQNSDVPRSAEIRIADSRGNWGYPGPFLHYPRGPGYVRMSWIFDTLVWKGCDGYVPALADSWSYDADRTAFVFHLNPDAVWHDGRPVTARDIAFTLEFFKKHPYHWITIDDVGRVETPGDRRVVIYLKRPFSPFIPNVAGTMPILPEHVWQSIDDPESCRDSRVFIGSGPYRFVDFNETQGTYLYEAFDDYYRGRPRAERLIYVHSGHPLASLITGHVDLAMIQPEAVETLRREGFAVIKDEREWVRKLMINHRKHPFSDKRFRQALAWAIDQREITEKAHRGFGAPASPGLLSPDHPMFNPDISHYSCNTDRARSLIEDMGYRKNAKGWYHLNGRPLNVKLLASNITAAGQRILDRDGDVIRMQLERVGIQVDLICLEQTTADDRIKNWRFDLALSGHGALTGDPLILNEMISTDRGGGSVNSARFDGDRELNRLLEAQVREMDEDRRTDLVHRIQEIHAELVPSIPLYYPDSFAAFHPGKNIVWFYTKGGIGKGIPIPQNKMSLMP